MSSKKYNRKIFFTSIIIFSIVITLWLYSYYYITTNYERADWGATGDLFGAVNGLFSGLAFAGLIITILLQSNELKEQRKELKLTRKAYTAQSLNSKIQIFEHSFYNLLNNTVELDLNQLDEVYNVVLKTGKIQNEINYHTKNQKSSVESMNSIKLEFLQEKYKGNFDYKKTFSYRPIPFSIEETIELYSKTNDAKNLTEFKELLDKKKELMSDLTTHYYVMNFEFLKDLHKIAFPFVHLFSQYSENCIEDFSLYKRILVGKFGSKYFDLLIFNSYSTLMMNYGDDMFLKMFWNYFDKSDYTIYNDLWDFETRIEGF